MKKIITSFLFSLAFLGAAPLSFATTTLCPSGNDNKFSVLCNGTLDPGAIISAFINWIFVLAVVFALFYLIWGGFKWLTSGGDKTAVGAARDHIVAAIVGLIIIFLSYLILNLIINFFIPGFKLNQFNLPTINGTTSTGSQNTCSPACTGGLVCHSGSCCAFNARSGTYAC